MEMSRRGLVSASAEIFDDDDTLAEITYAVNVSHLFLNRISPVALTTVQSTNCYCPTVVLLLGVMDARRGVLSFFYADWVFYARGWVGARLKYQKCAGKQRAFCVYYLNRISGST